MLRARGDPRVGARQLRDDPLLEKASESCELRVARAGVTHIFERARQVGQVARLAVAIPQAAEDPGTLMWRCTPMRSNQRRNCCSLWPAGPPCERSSSR